ncbi:MAG TPA: sugar phosphate nucleotidyltransferase, partial [Acidimicrobiales bacterium]|nr:sugar phosphate nucleotidyltransferase [Acidimicrobiales bacterium]
MRAVVLAGGEGTRLRPLTFTTPKQLLPVAGMPMVERVLGWLAAHGVEEAVLSLGYRPDAFVAAYPEQKAAGVRLRYAVEPEPLD